MDLHCTCIILTLLHTVHTLCVSLVRCTTWIKLWIILYTLGYSCFLPDAQSVVDIFLNYDCDLSLTNIYSRLTSDLSKIGQGRQPVELGATPQQERTIRMKVLGGSLHDNLSILMCSYGSVCSYFFLVFIFFTIYNREGGGG